jgi:DNA-binding NtrC family response regulator
MERPVKGDARIKVLAVDDDGVALNLVKSAAARDSGVDLSCVSSASEAFGSLAAARFDLVFLDLGLADREGTELLSDVIAIAGSALVAIVTGDSRPETIVDCMKRGAFDYVPKPAALSRFLAIFRHVRSVKELRQEINMLREEGESGERNPAFSRIVTRSSLMFELFRSVERVARSPFAVLIAGESGVGKELVARAVHDLSGRDGAFVPVNVAALDDALFSDTLFGHVRGAYTGAEGKRRGLVVEAERGTLFLDEIGDIGPESQAKLLRFLQEGEFYPLGSDKPEKSAARLVMATNADLSGKVRQGTFRADLFYRLMIHPVAIPPLRARREDIPLLVEKFAIDAATALSRPIPRSTEAFLAALDGWQFPGNVRELSSLVHGAVSRMEGGVLPASYALDYIQSVSRRTSDPCDCGSRNPDDPALAPVFFAPDGRFLTIDEITDRQIRAALKKSADNQSLAARLLGISQSTVSRWLDSHPMKNE